MKKPILTCVLIAVLFTGIVFANRHLTDIRREHPVLDNMAYLPGSERIKPFMLGFNTTYAHYLWIRTVIYTGDKISTARHCEWLVEMIDIITRLHPHFHEAYEFAGLMIPDLSGDPDAARVILERGINVLGGTRWQIPFYLAVLHFRDYQDNERAAVYMSIAAQVPGSRHDRLAAIAASFYNRAGREDDAIALLEFMYETSENPEVRRRIAAKMEELMETRSGEGAKDEG